MPVFPERFRSHHDAEQKLLSALGSRPAQADWPLLEKELRKKPAGKKRGIYFHVPHCDRICTFCNLNRKERKGADLDSYTDFLVSEIESWGAYAYVREQPFEAVYFGGGTPTVLSEEQLARVLKALAGSIPLSADCEISVESTLHNLGPDKAEALEEAGVNRFSIGIQTFSGRGRKLLGRSYDGEGAVKELEKLRRAFRGTLGIDIIYSYPGQSIEEVIHDGKTILESGADSVSFYSLMIQGSSSLAGDINEGKLTFSRTLEFDRERHNTLYRLLREGGFELLELSKLVRPGTDLYRYIRILYDNGEILPIGFGAGGNIAGFGIYSAAPGQRFVSRGNKCRDFYHKILGFLQFGVYDPEIVTRDLGEAARHAVREKIESYRARGLLEGGSGFRLSADGVFWGNNMAVEILNTAIQNEEKKEPV
ncbi:MAG: radical SAM protein [Treponema sp.]|jgi:oxygen-independent coproporphyrinogen-3 oxidase|nr:radical SAM protein [Treponema sp.]